jgi:hypothetical protein
MKFLPVVGFEGLYSVSDEGQIISEPATVVRQNGKLYRKSGRPLVARRSSTTGYLRVNLTAPGRRRTIDVHSVVAAAFLANPARLQHVNHIDGDKTNNVVTNLEWVSPKGNVRHAIANGLRGKGNAKLSAENVTAIRNLIDAGKARKSIAALFGVAPSTISMIAAGRNWSKLK